MAKNTQEDEKPNVVNETKASDPLLDEPATPEEKPTNTPVITTVTPAPAATSKHKFDLKTFLATKKGKIVAALVVLGLVIGVVFAVPASRYAVAGLVIKKDVQVEVVDSETGKPISSADVALANQTAKTDANGKATFKNVPVGNWSVSATKKYYESAKTETLVPILTSPSAAKVSIVATGRQVPVSLTNKVSGAALGGVEITAGESVVTTAENGEATIVLPADKPTASATFTASGYNSLAADITVTEQEDDKNKFALTPVGKVYFLSKRTGKINVMSANLDGSNAEIVLAGTGKESETTTVLLASRDWKYLALLAKRDSNDTKVYLITTADNKLTLIDEGKNTDFSPVGWYNEHFAYTVTRNDTKDWEPKRQSLKSYNAATKKLATLDDSAAAGTNASNWQREIIDSVYILENQLVYSKHWDRIYTAPALTADKKDGMYAVRPNGEGKQTLKAFSFNGNGYISARLYRPQEVYFRVVEGAAKPVFYEYEDGKLEVVTSVDDNSFYNQTYPTYLVSPSGKATFWSEDRDGKQVIFKGDNNGANGKEVLVSHDYSPYGWYTDDYLLLSKNKSELYIFPVNGSDAPKPFKVTDYHKPTYTFPGYGYGYGGL
jgi:hypothetical protein